MPLQAGIVEGRLRLAIEPDQPPRIGEQFLTIFRQPVGPAILLKQGLADTFFQPSHLHRYGRLRAMHLVGRLGETAGVGNHDEGLKLVEIEGRFHRTSITNVDWIH